MKGFIQGVLKSRSGREWRLPWLWLLLLLGTTTGCEPIRNDVPSLSELQQRTRTPRPAQSPRAAQIETAIRDRINVVRQQNGLSALKHNEQLAEVARTYSKQMAERNFFSHTGVDGSTVAQRVKSAGIFYWTVGENLFKGTNLPEPVSAAVEGWLNSPGHRANVLRSTVDQTGIGVWQINQTIYITQLFLR